jgi:hypothetical protein
MKPRQSAPESPMKIRAGEEVVAQESEARAGNDRREDRGVGLARARVRGSRTSTPAIPQTPAARPSIPSRKLTMFITATMNTIDSGDADPRGDVEDAEERGT